MEPFLIKGPWVRYVSMVTMVSLQEVEIVVRMACSLGVINLGIGQEVALVTDFDDMSQFQHI